MLNNPDSVHVFGLYRADAERAANAGLGQIEGTALTALMIGLTRAFIIYIQPEFEVLVPYLLMVLVLLVRPFGLFGAVQVRKI